MNESIDHFPSDATLIDQIGKDAVHVFVGLRQCEWFVLLALVLQDWLCVETQQVFHCINIAKPQELSHECDGIAADLFVLVIEESRNY